VKLRTLAVTTAVTALTLAMTGTALAAPLGKPKPKPAPAAQITGSKLVAGLLPGVAFGGGDTTAQPFDTGNRLLSAKNAKSVPSMPCLFLGTYSPGYGQTAIAADVFGPPTSNTGGPFGMQVIYQFASTSAASSYLAQEAARFQSRACHTQTNTSAGTTITTTFEHLSRTKISGYPAIDVTDSATITPAIPPTYQEYTVVNAGTNVYTIWESSSTNTGVPASLLSEMIKSTQKLYPAKK
jgi:hypothetical protein